MRSREPYVSAESEYYVYTPSAAARRLFFYPVCVGHFVYEPGYLLKRNSYDSFLIMLVTDGSCTVTLNERTASAQKGEIIFLDCYSPHQYGSQTGWEGFWLHFDGPMAREYFEEIFRLSGSVIKPENPHPIEQSLSAIYNMFRNNRRLLEPVISQEIVSILTRLLLFLTEKETTARSQLSLSESIAYINEHFAEEISLPDLASRAGLSPYYFTRLFSRETGMTPHQYIIATRINSAKFLLKTTDLSVKQIGFSSGFQSESSFCTTFKKWVRLTPNNYRELEL